LRIRSFIQFSEYRSDLGSFLFRILYPINQPHGIYLDWSAHLVCNLIWNSINVMICYFSLVSRECKTHHSCAFHSLGLVTSLSWTVLFSYSSLIMHWFMKIVLLDNMKWSDWWYWDVVIFQFFHSVLNENVLLSFYGF
jgi:hypothetical protein